MAHNSNSRSLSAFSGYSLRPVLFDLFLSDNPNKKAFFDDYIFSSHSTKKMRACLEIMSQDIFLERVVFVRKTYDCNFPSSL